MTFLQSAWWLLFSFAVMVLCGLGPTLTLLPKELRKYSLFVTPAIGYLTFCFFSIWLSGLTDSPIVQTNIWTLIALSTWAVTSLIYRRIELNSIVTASKWIPILLGLMVLVVFLPALHMGAASYLGTVNPDFYQSLSLQDTLVRFNAPFWIDREALPLSGPFPEMFPDAFQARFGGVSYSILLNQFLGIEPQATLLISIISFLTCLPLATYFFSRTVLELNKQTSILSAVFVVIAAPTTMSFIHTFVGQNSALSSLPLCIALVYLALRQGSVGTTILATIALNGVFYIYVIALPYILAPFGLFFLLEVFKFDWKKLKSLIGLTCLAITISAGLQLSVYSITVQFFKDLFDLLGLVTQSLYYADFLTEEVLVYAMGLTSYPLSQSMYFYNATRLATVILVGVGGVLAAIYFFAVWKWAKQASTEAVAVVSSILFVYLAVWIKYTFFTRYGYASFKMSAWLQFIAVPFFAWTVYYCLEGLKNSKQTKIKKSYNYFILLSLIGIYAGLNLASDLDYGLKSYGHDRTHGSIINSYGISNNPDHSALQQALKSIARPGSTVALGFGDSIENFWASYYLYRAGLKTTILSHEEIPFEDANLPDIHNRHYTDTLGRTQVDLQKYFHNAYGDYFLLPGRQNLNTDIVLNNAVGTPLWQDDSFALYKKGNVKDIVTTGRGFFRVEHMDTSKLNWWWPETYRWSAEGGEIYLFMPSLPGAPYQIEFSAIAGLGVSTGERTIELWHNGELFDEVVVRGIARIISRPYYPVKGSNRIVLRVKEKAILTPRNSGLWNRKLPLRSTLTNILFSQIRITNDNTKQSLSFPLGTWVEPKTLFNELDEFNGFDVDGWVRDSADIRLSTLPAVTKVSFRVLVPGNLEFKFPYNVKFQINGKAYERAFTAPGEHLVQLDLTTMNIDGKMHIEIFPQQAQHLADGMAQREVLQSIKLSAIKFDL